MRTNMEVVEPVADADNTGGRISTSTAHPGSERRQRLIEKIASESHSLVGNNRSRQHLTEMLLSGLSRYANLPQDEISLFSSADRIAEILLNAFCLAGEEILVCEPASGRMQDLALAHMIKMQSHHGYSPFSADPRGIEEHLSEKTRLIFLENPNHTTGTVYGQSELVYLLEHAGDAMVVLDESYADYIGGGAADLLGRHANLVIIGRFPVLPGPDIEPLGYIMANREIMQFLPNAEKERALTTKQLATAVAALNNIHHVREHIETIRENIIYLSAKLRSLGVSCRISPIDFLLAKVANPKLIAAELRREGIEVREINYLPQLTGYISISVGDDSSGARIAEAFERMPRHYYVIRKPVRSRVTLRRRPENGVDRTEKHKEKTDVVAGSIDGT